MEYTKSNLIDYLEEFQKIDCPGDYKICIGDRDYLIQNSGFTMFKDAYDFALILENSEYILPLMYFKLRYPTKEAHDANQGYLGERHPVSIPDFLQEMYDTCFEFDWPDLRDAITHKFGEKKELIQLKSFL